MDIQLQELLDKLRKEGVEAAQAESASIVAEAEERRRAMLAASEKEAKAIVAKAEQDAARFQASSVAAIKQASRNLLLAFKSEIEKVLNGIALKETEKALDEKTLQALLPGLLSSLAQKGSDELVLLVPQAQLASIEAFFVAKLKKELGAGLEIKPFPGLKSGLRVSLKDGSGYYDFSGEAVAALLSRYVNERLADIMRSAAQES